MKLFILVLFAIITMMFCDSVPQIQLKDENLNKGYILETNNQTCITTVDTKNYKYDLWYANYQHNPKYDKYLICCNEPFSSETIIPSLGLKNKTSLDIIEMDFDVLTSGNTNCSIYYGSWFYGEIPPTAYVPITGTELTIHPLTVKTLLG